MTSTMASCRDREDGDDHTPREKLRALLELMDPMPRGPRPWRSERKRRCSPRAGRCADRPEPGRRDVRARNTDGRTDYDGQLLQRARRSWSSSEQDLEHARARASAFGVIERPRRRPAAGSTAMRASRSRSGDSQPIDHARRCGQRRLLAMSPSTSEPCGRSRSSARAAGSARRRCRTPAASCARGQPSLACDRELGLFVAAPHRWRRRGTRTRFDGARAPAGTGQIGVRTVAADDAEHAARLRAGRVRRSACAPSRPTMPSTVRVAQCRESPLSHSAHAPHPALISPTTRSPRASGPPPASSTMPTNSWPMVP